MKKYIAILLTLAVVLSMAACAAKEEAPATSAPVHRPSIEAVEPTGTTITLLNTKSELQELFESMAARYLRDTGVEVEVTYSGEGIYNHLADKYDAGTPYTMAMVGANILHNVYDYDPDFLTDMSGEEWVQYTDYALTRDDKVLGFPLGVEATGILYNGSVIEELTGRPFNPDSVATLDDFRELLDELSDAGMRRSCGIQRENWSLASDYLMQAFAEQLDPAQFMDFFYAGYVDLDENVKFNNFLDTFDTLKEYNYAYKLPASADRQTTLEMLGEGKIAFVFGGNWDWRYINNSEYTDKIGIMPVPQNTTDESNERLVGGVSEFFYVDGSEDTNEEERQAALDFLNWLAMDVAGNAFLTDDCGMIPAFTNITTGYMDPLGQIVKEYMDRKLLIDTFEFFPMGYEEVAGAYMQQMLTNQLSRADFFQLMEEFIQYSIPVPCY